MLVISRCAPPAWTRCVGRQFESKRQMPTPRWHTTMPSSSSNSMPSGPAWPPESWMATPVFDGVPPAISGRRQICCARVMATYTCEFFVFRVMRVGDAALPLVGEVEVAVAGEVQVVQALEAFAEGGAEDGLDRAAFGIELQQ